MALSKQGIILPSTTCCQCNLVEETSDHALIRCSFARKVMTWILKWCNITIVNFHTVNEVLDYASNWGNCPKKKKRLLGICYGTLWGIWKARNERLFNNQLMCALKVVNIIQSITFLWFRHRGDGGGLNWTKWNVLPFNSLQWFFLYLF
ncbi:uncharacterized protein LOC111911013 [Lactuca sativa]|uniref:uncharacterized protein LOC111911013 n=1 Tax=Lactuca sativa TaxID=4236 RepID=UPI000CD9E04B|nr:uncharacterized protein LOC111911013 [Lactuca sativa]